MLTTLGTAGRASMTHAAIHLTGKSAVFTIDLMDRISRRCLALVRALLVALGLSLMGAEPIGQIITLNEVHSAQAEGVGLPNPDALVAGEREEELRGPSEDDDLAHGPGSHLVVLGPCARRIQVMRGPPAPAREVNWRPRSSRGPPVQV